MCKNRKAAATTTIVKIIENTRTLKRLKEKAGEVRTPRLPNINEERHDGSAENKRFNAIPAMNLFALKLSIKSEKITMRNVDVKEERINPITEELVTKVKK